jgi:hypothetical protein
MVLDFAGRTGDHNPARDRLTVKLPREVRDEPKRQQRSRSSRSTASSLRRTGSLCSFSTRPVCASANSRRSPGRRRRSEVAVARLAGCREDGSGSVGCRPRAAIRRRPRARTAGRPDTWAGRVPGRYGRSSANRHLARMHGGGRAGVLAARPPAPSDLPLAPQRRAVGPDRRAPHMPISGVTHQIGTGLKLRSSRARCRTTLN